MGDNRRISMNTSLKDARIFDEDSWESEQIPNKLPIKTEIKDKPIESICGEQIANKLTVKNGIENEPVESIRDEQITSKLSIKTEIEDEPIESICDDAQFEINFKSQQEKLTQFEIDFNLEQGKPDLNFSSIIKQEKYDEISSFNFKPEPVDSSVMEFSFNEEFDIGLVKQELEENTTDSTDSASNQSRKSIKKSVFKRDTPYLKREADTMEGTSHTNCKDSRFNSDNRNNSEKVKKRKYDYETDPEVLSRRQKQIDFGKNTIGYDNYIRKLSRRERTSKDPVTPNKYMKYSRRAWDGLVRQWRLRLHKYDPSDN